MQSKMTHPAANIFPMMSDAELRELSQDIKANGLQHPIVIKDGYLLDGRNRYEACKMAGVNPVFEEYTGESPVSFIISANLKRRHLDASQKATIAVEIEPHFAEEARKRQATSTGGKSPQLVEKVPQAEGKARDQAAKVVGVSGKMVSEAKAIKKSAPEVFEKIKSGKLTVSRAKKEIKADTDRRALVEAQENITTEKRKSIKSVCDLRVCSCAELLSSGIKPDVVITDPPYPEQFLPVFSELARACKQSGVPLVAVMSGQSYLPEVLRSLCEHLTYRWTLAYMTPGGQAVQLWQRKVNTFWKPVLLFGESSEWIGDVAESKTNDNDKRFHGWGQSETGMRDLVERLSKPGQLVCDPFCGAGTTGVVSLALGRRFVGCDINKESVKTALARCEVVASNV